MNIQTAYSTQSSAQVAAAEIKGHLQKLPANMLIYFASSNYSPDEVGPAMQAAFPDATVFGCTTAGEIISGRMLKNSIVAMAFNQAVVADAAVATLTDIKTDAANAVTQAFAKFEQHYGVKMLDADPAQYVGLILVDGLSGAEEKLMERIGDLTDVTFIGASAGDDLKFARTHVFVQGQAHTDAAVLALVKTAAPFDFIKTQSFSPMKKTLTPTRVNRETREVLEFNSQPAAAAYAAALDVTPGKLADYFMTNPVGLMADGEPFIRSPQQIKGNSVIFYCAVSENMELQVMHSTDIIEDTRQALQDSMAAGRIQGLINFHCILRTLELEKKEQTEAYGKLFSEIPTIGFSTYGEEFIGHINQTSTMLVFR